MTGAPSRCLVLGAGGFLGQHVTATLTASGFATRSFIRSATKTGLEARGSQAETYYGNFLAPEHLGRAFQGCDTCIHLITTTFPRTANDDIVFDVESNLLGTLRLVEIALQNNCKRFVYISSGGTVYGSAVEPPIPETAPLSPISAYGLTKATIENYLELYQNSFGLDSVVLRVANPYGPLQRSDGSQGIIPAFIRAAVEGRPVRLYGDGNQQRDYVYVSDVARAVQLALTSQSKFRTFNIGSGVGHSIVDIMRLIETVTKRQILIERVPANPVDVLFNYLDNQLAREELQWTPSVQLEDGIAQTYAWLTSEYGPLS